MENNKTIYTAILSSLIALALCSFLAQAALGQTETLDIVTYTPPAGWTKTPNNGAVILNNFNAKTRASCSLTIYPSSASAGDPRIDFADKWNQLVAGPYNAPRDAKGQTATGDDGVQVSAGSSVVEVGGVRSLAVLTVYTGFGRAAAVLAIANDRSYGDQVTAFLASIKLDEKASSGSVAGNVLAVARVSQPGPISKTPIDTESKLAATDVGTPKGQAITKSIGPAGGSLASADGRMTLRIPPGVVPAPVTFSIQSITNQAQGGLGSAYRLEPNGQTFAKPVELVLKYSDEDLKGTAPEALTLAYQDDQKVWYMQTTTKLDQAAKTITVSTTHFCDWSWLPRAQLSPASDTLKVGQSLAITGQIVCLPQKNIERLLGKLNCPTTPDPKRMEWSLQGPGSLEGDGSTVIYTAPSQKPSPNVALVKLDLDYTQEGEGRVETHHLTLTATITIIGRGYKYEGATIGTRVSSSAICSLDKPFSILVVENAGTRLELPVRINFDPGRMFAFYDVNAPWATGGLTYNRKAEGSYSVAETEASLVKVIWHQISSTITMTVPQSPVVRQEMPPTTLTFVLQPLDTNECDR